MTWSGPSRERSNAQVLDRAISRLSKLNRQILRFAFLILCLFVTAPSSGAQDDQAKQEAAWPRQIKTDKGPVVIYQPQLDALDDDVLKGRAAFSLRKAEASEPEFGALWFSSKVDTDRDERTARIFGTTISRVRLPDASEEENNALAKAVEAKVSGGEMSLSLDRLVAALSITEQERKEATELKTSPPKIVVREKPAVLVYIDGDPTMVPIDGTKLLQVENSPFPIVLDPKSKAYYLNGGDIWYKASEVKGPWRHVDQVPGEISKLLELSEEEKKDLKGDVSDERIPEIVVATEPTELLFIDGKPKFTPLVGTELLYVKNTESPLFFDTETEDYFVLLSGRWYSANSLDEGGWEFVPPDELPEAFAEIPTDSDLAEVRSSVAGTDEAEEAVLDASIPQTTAISRKDAKLEVAYNGEPQFEPVPKTKIKRAVNTQYSVLEIDGIYYAVDQGVWYVADSPNGPWRVAEEVPDQVDDIPPSSPAYNVKYVKIYDSTPEYVYFGYTPGYVGSYVLFRTIVYGTGYWYRCGYRRYYYACPLTWGFGAFYRPWAGWTLGLSHTRFHFHVGFRGGYRWHLSHHRNARYRGGWWGPGGYHPRRYDRYRARHHKAAYANHRRNIYNRPDNLKRNQFKDRRPAERPGHKIANTRPNNVFTDKNGNIYRRTKDGWQKRAGKDWVTAKLPGDKRPGEGRPSTRPGDKLKPGDKVKPGQRPDKSKPAKRPADKTKPAKRPADKAKPAKRPAKKKPDRSKQASTKKRKPASAKTKQKKRKSTARKPANRKATSKRRKQSTQHRRTAKNRSHNLNRQHRARSRGSARTHQSRARRSGGASRGGGRRGGGRRR